MEPLGEKLKEFINWLQAGMQTGAIPKTRETVKLRTVADDLRIDADRFGAQILETGAVRITSNLARRIVTDDQENVKMSDPLSEWAPLTPSVRVKALLKEFPPGQDPVANLALFIQESYPKLPTLSDGVVNFANLLMQRQEFIDEHRPRKDIELS